MQDVLAFVDVSTPQLAERIVQSGVRSVITGLHYDQGNMDHASGCRASDCAGMPCSDHRKCMCRSAALRGPVHRLAASRAGHRGFVAAAISVRATRLERACRVASLATASRRCRRSLPERGLAATCRSVLPACTLRTSDTASSTAQHRNPNLVWRPARDRHAWRRRGLIAGRGLVA